MAVTYPIINLNINNETIQFRDADVIEAEVVQEIHPAGMELPASTARIRVWLDNEIVDENNRTLRDKFSPFSSGIYYQEMVTGLVVDVNGFVDGGTYPIGRFYLQEWNNPKQGELELVCIDAIGILDQKTYLGYFYELPTTVRAIVADIMAGTELTYTIDPVIANKTLKGYLPGNKTLRESLQHVLFVAGAYAKTAGVFDIKIKETILPHGMVTYPVYYYDDAAAVYDNAGATYAKQHIDAYITDDEKTDSQSLNILQLVTGVEIMSHDYAKGTVVEEIFSAQLTPGDYMVVYPKPYHWVSATGIGDAITYLATANDTVDEIIALPQSYLVEGDDYYEVILTGYGEFEFGVNYVYLTVPEVEGEIPEVVVTGKPWLDSTQLFKWQNPDATRAFSQGFVYDDAAAVYGTATYRRDWEVVAPPNVWKIDDATLAPSIRTVGEETVDAMLARVSDYAKLRYQQNVTLFPRTDVEPGEIDLIDSLYGKQIVGVVERMVSKLSGGYLIDAEFIGTERTTI